MNEQECMDSILDTLSYRLEQVDGGNLGTQWCYSRDGYGGRGYDYIPIQYITEDEIEMLLEEALDDYESTYDYDPDNDYDTFEELFNQVFNNLVEENLGN